MCVRGEGCACDGGRLVRVRREGWCVCEGGGLCV